MAMFRQQNRIILRKYLQAISAANGQVHIWCSGIALLIHDWCKHKLWTSHLSTQLQTFAETYLRNQPLAANHLPHLLGLVLAELNFHISLLQLPQAAIRIALSTLKAMIHWGWWPIEQKRSKEASRSIHLSKSGIVLGMFISHPFRVHSSPKVANPFSSKNPMRSLIWPPSSLHQQHRQSPAECSTKGFWILCNGETTWERRKQTKANRQKTEPIQRLQNFIDMFCCFLTFLGWAMPPFPSASGSSHAFQYFPGRWEAKRANPPSGPKWVWEVVSEWKGWRSWRFQKFGD